MIHARLEDPPESIQTEAKALHSEYMAQFGDEFPEDFDPAAGFRQFIMEHGSKEYREYTLEVERIMKIATEEGIRL